VPAGEDTSTRVLYSTFLAKKVKLKAPYEQYGLYLSCGAGLAVLGRNLVKASQLLEIQACTDAAKMRDMQVLGKFLDYQVEHAAMYVARFRTRGIAAGVSVPLLWLAWRFAVRNASSGGSPSKGKTEH